MGFELNRVAPGVTHIRDAMGVCMTLIEGEKAALLVDTGYGTEDLSALMKELIGVKPLHVFLTHHHHDHVLGVRTLSTQPTMLDADAPAFGKYTSRARREAVLAQARAKGLHVDEARFLNDAIEQPATAHLGDIDLGGLTARIIECPTHTPGSAAVLIAERKILLTGDCWNPCTWVFFDEAPGIQVYRRNIRKLQMQDFDHVLCSHQHVLYPRKKFDDFVDHLTDDVLRAAHPVTIGGNEHIDTRQADVVDDQILVFDWNKSELG